MQTIENNLADWWPKLAAATEHCEVVGTNGAGAIQLIFRSLSSENFWFEVSMLKFVTSTGSEYSISVNSSVAPPLYRRIFNTLPPIEEFRKALRFAMETYFVKINMAREMLFYLAESTTSINIIA